MFPIRKYSIALLKTTYDIPVRERANASTFAPPNMASLFLQHFDSLRSDLNVRQLLRTPLHLGNVLNVWRLVTLLVDYQECQLAAFVRTKPDRSGRPVFTYRLVLSRWTATLKGSILSVVADSLCIPVPRWDNRDLIAVCNLDCDLLASCLNVL